MECQGPCGGGEEGFRPSPVIGILAQRRLVGVVGSSCGRREARMRRSRPVLGVEAIL